jgi:hypothetical protein
MIFVQRISSIELTEIEKERGKNIKDNKSVHLRQQRLGEWYFVSRGQRI